MRSMFGPKPVDQQSHLLFQQFCIFQPHHHHQHTQTHTLIQACNSIFVSTLLDIIHSPAPHCNSNRSPYLNQNTNFILKTKSDLINSSLKLREPAKNVLISQNCPHFQWKLYSGPHFGVYTNKHTHLILKPLGVEPFFLLDGPPGRMAACLCDRLSPVHWCRSWNTNSPQHTVHAEPPTLNHMHTHICRQAERAGPPT